MNDRMMQSKEGNAYSSKALDVGLVVTECNETESEWHVSSNRSEKYTHDENADINSVNDKQLMAKVQLTTEHNILANEQQHYEQSGSIYDTYLLEKVDKNTTPDSTNMSHRGGEINQNAVKCQVSCPLLDPSFDNMTTEFSNQSLESEKIFQEWKHIVCLAWMSLLDLCEVYLPVPERHASGHVFRLGPVWGCDSLVSRAKVIENQVMTISVISISSDSSEGSVGTPAGRVILFGTIPTTIPDTTPVIIPPTTQTDTTVIPTETPIIAPTIPPSPDYTPASPDYSPASDSESDPSEDPSSDHIPPLPATSPFLSSDDDTTDSDSPDTPPSPTHGTPFTEITSSTQRSPVIPRRRVMILAPGQPIPHGRPYRYHLNGPVHMMTARKRVGPLPTHRLAVRHSADHSSSDSSSEASSDFHSDASSDSSSRHSLSDHSSPDLPSTSAGPSRKRRRSPMTSVPALPLVSEALSPVRADLIPHSPSLSLQRYL
ncbi:hypothetical protein Tco_0631150 [Tanacetum coccineum]